MKDYLTYEVGDITTFSGVDFIVEFVNETVAIAHCKCLSAMFAIGIHIDPEYRIMPHEEVRSYMGDAFHCLTGYDIFVNMYSEKINNYGTLNDLDGEQICYHILNDEDDDIRVRCGGQDLNKVFLIKAFGHPRPDSTVIPLTETELAERNLFPDGNYYWYIPHLSKKLIVKDWVDITVWNTECNYDIQYTFSGYVVYSHNNWAVVQSHEGFLEINGEFPYKLISYEELSVMLGFTACFKHYDTDKYVLIEQETGETTEAFMPYIATMPDGEKVHCCIYGYRYQKGRIIGRYVNLDEDYYMNNNCSDNACNDSNGRGRFYLDELKNRYSGIEVHDAYLPSTDDYLTLYYIPLQNGETVSIIHE